MRRVRTSNNRQVGFAYTPNQAEVSELMVLGRSEVQAKELQRYIVVPEGVDLPDSVAAYALHLYSTQMEEVSAQPLPVAPVAPVEPVDPSSTTGVTGGAEVVGETLPAPTPAEPPPLHAISCDLRTNSGEDCDGNFTAKTLSAAKSKLRAHNRKDHSA